MHALRDAHDTPLSPTSSYDDQMSAGLTGVHCRPFPRSATRDGRESEFRTEIPTTMQKLDGVHDTPPNEPVESREIGSFCTMVQADPFHCSMSGSPYLLPTATQLLADEHETADS
jgi:hypothetical protein